MSVTLALSLNLNKHPSLSRRWRCSIAVRLQILMASSSGKSDYSRELNPPALRKYSYEELSKATQHFSNNNWLGSGGFGDVFRGSLDSECVAIKKLKHKKYGEPEEIKCHKRVSQPILVKLIGYCHEGADKLLVLEYVPNKTLRHHLDDN
uniref:non-specific serine/threonine protein kinase n=1 Tax=Manihot esculenta TaxID=3983 RepID=A0A2C9UY17_MANES